MTKTNNSSPALQIAMAYFEAWRNRDHATAMKVVADDVVNETPFGTTEGGEALHKGESGFAHILKGATLIAAFGDEKTALLMYYTHTQPVESVLSSKHFTVENGKIIALKAVFDKSAFAAQ
ncbi:nuclear transport factor 2 family protein [Pectobacterium versatile]|uniref:nuclear transport factor 2 family protein n=1 Tax=Pectobacterium versatile TaxID=2488639 RepID=UPI001B3984C6|nr:nuclear transport factor 2 family protein [Pectobacterium versatile]MBQ4780384.1 nuclear transport factor 2 family protein [Pectobacterium versatile]MBQ4784779.1 nuclear transport factor 2 family protein [Pectobacterium versatile]MBQ4793765.1 nuclear transport factor 2 family protein [Pectobacterium versatile]